VSPRPAKARTTIALGMAGLVFLAVGCGRSGSSSPPVASSAPPATSSSSAAAAKPGSFGDLGQICKPGTPTGPTSRGVTNSEIHLGTLGDPGAAADPGLEQEFFDVGDAFTKWCNAAGGINGRKIVLTKRDAKLFEGAQQIVNACQSDFMLVGGGNAIDAPNVKPRLACKLGQIPAYVVSPEASRAGLQVTAAPNIPTEFQVGDLRLLAQAYPATQKHLAIGSSSIASLQPQGKKAKQAYESLGYTVTVVQEKPASVDNYRPYMEELKGNGSLALDEIVGLNLPAEITAMNNVGFKPSYILFSTPVYAPSTVAAANATPFPTSYVGLNHLPFELAGQYPVVNEVKTILAAGASKPKYTDFTDLSFNAWLLWAKSASECGSNLTQDCVLEKAAKYTDWTAGGLYAPISTIPGQQHMSDCVLLMRLTTSGWVYDKKVTAPNKGAFNCDSKNVATTDSFGT
jgi:ABC-type branched-subunit amino acid transport system substrate-binding protein